MKETMWDIEKKLVQIFELQGVEGMGWPELLMALKDHGIDVDDESALADYLFTRRKRHWMPMIPRGKKEVPENVLCIRKPDLDNMVFY